MSTPTPISTPNTGINNLTNFLATSNSQLQLILVVGIFIIIIISVSFILKNRRR
jgi:hypothetical protein